MSTLTETLRQCGCNMEVAMERFLNDEEFYQDCLKQALCDDAFGKLGEALRAHQIKEAFDYAHTLKGVIANMELKSMYDAVVEIVEPLRQGTDEGLLSVYDRLLEERKKYQEISDRFH